MRRWEILNKRKAQSAKRKTKETEDIIKVLLNNRGLRTKKQIKEFLNPPHPYKLKLKSLGISKKELNKAIKRIKKAIENKESIIVYSDFDADGICGAAILWETLNSLGAKAMPYIPDRIKEGYGLSKEGIDQVLKEYQAGLIITVDLGITGRKEVGYAKKKGTEVIISDHHLKPKKLPSALAIIHTTLLSGSAVAWVLAKELIKEKELSSKDSNDLLDHLALASIGTIADLILLIGPSRSIVKYGLQELNQTKRIGLKALFKTAGLEKGKIGTYEVSFMIAPRLNAMGRLVHAIDSLRLLCTKNPDRASSLAQKLGQTNRERQKLLEETVTHARGNLTTEQRNNEITKLIFLSHESYHEGVIGLVASKLVEKFSRPAIVVAQGKEYSKASARSINGFDIVRAIRSCSNLLVDCGGHPMAAGFTVETKHLGKVKSKLEQLAAKEISQELLSKTLKIDCQIELADINFKLYEKISQLEPFGIGNPQPIFVTRGVIIQDARVVGSDGKHLSLNFPLPTSHFPLRGIAFNLGHLYSKLSPSKPIDIVYTISVDEWNGQRRLQLKIKDVKFSA